MVRKSLLKKKPHEQIFFLGASLQECREVEKIAQGKTFNLEHKAYCTQETPLSTLGHPNPATQNWDTLETFALKKLVPGRFTHIAVNKANRAMKELAISLRRELAKNGINIGILAL